MKLSIIVPAHNCEKYIQKTIKSILSQNYKKFELIIINDGSTDKTSDKIKKIKDQRITLINTKNQGVAQTRNIGINASHGEYIIFIDADDYLEPNMLNKFINIADKYKPDLTICGFYSETNKKNKDKFQSEEKYYSNKQQIKEDLVKLYNHDLLYNVWNKMYKKEIITKNNIKFPNINFGEDNYFNQEYLKNTKTLYNINDCLYHYVRENNNSITTKYIPNLFEIRIKENQDFIKLFDYFDINYKTYINFISNHFIERTIGCLENIHRKNNLTFKDKIKETKKIITHEETKKYLKTYNTNNKKIKIILKTYNKHPIIPYTIGKSLCIIKKHCPNLFNKQKNKRK